MKQMLAMLRRKLRVLLPAASSKNTPLPAAGLLPRIEAERVSELSQTLSRKLFSKLLTELPAYRVELSGFYHAGDIERMAQCNHKLLGAVVYCDAPELQHGLGDLQQALKTGDTRSIDVCFRQAINVIDNTLAGSGRRSP